MGILMWGPNETRPYVKCPSTVLLFLLPVAPEIGDELSLWLQTWRSSRDILGLSDFGCQLQGFLCSLEGRQEEGKPGSGERKEGENKKNELLVVDGFIL